MTVNLEHRAMRQYDIIHNGTFTTWERLRQIRDRKFVVERTVVLLEAKIKVLRAKMDYAKCELKTCEEGLTKALDKYKYSPDTTDNISIGGVEFHFNEVNKDDIPVYLPLKQLHLIEDELIYRTDMEIANASLVELTQELEFLNKVEKTLIPLAEEERVNGLSDLEMYEHNYPRERRIATIYNVMGDIIQNGRLSAATVMTLRSDISSTTDALQLTLPKLDVNGAPVYEDGQPVHSRLLSAGLQQLLLATADMRSVEVVRTLSQLIPSFSILDEELPVGGETVAKE